MTGDSDLAIAPLSALKSEVAAEIVAQLRPLLMATAESAGTEDWLDAKGAADYLCLSRNAFYKLTQTGKLRPWQETENGKMYFKKRWLDEYRGESHP